jgi:serralysin
MSKLNFFNHSFYVALIISVYGCANNPDESNKQTEPRPDSVITKSKDQELKNIHLCTELLPPPPPSMHIAYESDTSIFPRDNAANDTLVYNSLRSNKAYITSLIAYRWALNQRDIKVSFLDGDPLVQQKVKTAAKQWESYCGLNFVFGNFADADITISFLYAGSWSYIGTYSKKMRPSMNFGWLYAGTPQDEIDRVVLHEFGHAIGFVHEHQNPNGNILWDKKKVYAYYKLPPNNWDTPTVDQNIFYKYSAQQINATAFDPKSIMLYSIPASLTTNGFSTPENSQLSDSDKAFVNKMYPKHQ